MSSTVSAEWLREHLRDPDVIAADCRFLLSNPLAGKQAYEAGHLPGAVYFDLERDLSAEVGLHGGRHPLPDPELLAAKLGTAGIDENAIVVAYDDQGGAMASRLWWLLTYYGHPRVYVLEGGYSGWSRSGFEISTDVPSREGKTFVPKLRRDLLAETGDVERSLGDRRTILVDSREIRRYKGLEEPIDKTAGHIPGAVHYFWQDVFTSEGRLKTPELLKEHFRELEKSEQIIVYCGSGVTACPNVLALAEAGFANVRLYSGSWSDWISYPEHPVATLK